MPRERMPKGFTLVEVATVLAVLSLLALAASLSLRSTEKTGLDTQARNSLVGFTAAQNLNHDTMGYFVSSPADAPSILAGFTFVPAATSSTSDTEISFKTSTQGGFDYVAAATLSASGRCFVAKVFEPSSPTEDLRRFFEPDAITCSANSVDALSGGESW